MISMPLKVEKGIKMRANVGQFKKGDGERERERKR